MFRYRAGTVLSLEEDITPKENQHRLAIERTPEKDGPEDQVENGGSQDMRLKRIREEIENGTYLTEGKLRIAFSYLINDVLSRIRKRPT